MTTDYKTSRAGEDLPTLITSPLPTNLEIRMAMEMVFGFKLSPFALPIIQPCADIAEKMMIRFVTQAIESGYLPPPATVRIAQKRVHHQGGGNRSARWRETGYKCPNCRKNDIRRRDNFCGACGRPIKWV